MSFLLLCKIKRQYLLNYKVSRYCLLAFQSSARQTCASDEIWLFFSWFLSSSELSQPLAPPPIEKIRISFNINKCPIRIFLRIFPNYLSITTWNWAFLSHRHNLMIKGTYLPHYQGDPWIILFFIRLKLELLKQFPALNESELFRFMRNRHF